ncbi:MAG: sigma-70 family RNA polymerase sigma factor [Candidatus Omnitrophota bacterium]|jgi:RNA polymerase sigma-70 factor (ECF subfamily)|nr:MAG: sigma-70 family RNA polymerase sigma factor [Candidatus Omnitrophota bacterium]
MNENEEFENRPKGNTREAMSEAASSTVEITEITFCEKTQENPDVTALRLWKNGNMRGYNDLVQRYERPLFCFIHRLIRDADETKDILQETYVRLYRSLPSLREDKNLKSWLFQTANRLCIDHFRKIKPNRVMTVDHQDASFVASIEAEAAEHPEQPDACLQDRQMQGKIQEAIQALPQKQRMIMNLRSSKDLSLKEIAEIMGCSEKTVGTALFSARKKLVKILKPLLEDMYGRSASQLVRKGVGL